jgi:hypothetical protein
LRPIIFLSASVAVTFGGIGPLVTSLGECGLGSRLAAGTMRGSARCTRKEGVENLIAAASTQACILRVRQWSLLILILALAVPVEANASSDWLQNRPSVQCDSVTYADGDGDGHPDRLRADCRFDEETTGAIVIFRRGDAMQPGAHPALGGDLVDDIWIFDTSADGTAELVMIFHTEGAASVADLYDARQDPEGIEYNWESGDFTLDNDARPIVRALAPDGWWVKGSQTNFNLDIYVDGPVEAVLADQTEVGSWAKTDGLDDVVIHVRDLDDDGRPDLDWRTHNAPDAWAHARSFLMVNHRDDEVTISPVFPWPYLGGESFGYLMNSPSGLGQPPIQMDWQAGHITAIGEFVASRANDGQWFVYSPREIKAGIVNEPNFENPFAWYDLAQDGDRRPELAVRVVHYAANDEYYYQGRLSQPVNLIRYSWDQDNDDSWDYKLGLIGNYEIDSVVSFPEFQVRTVPYEEVPNWVVERPWDVALFVAPEGLQVSGEGIYLWDPTELLVHYYLGFSDVFEPVDAEVVADNENNLMGDFPHIKVGFRGEYQLALRERPILYFSAVDRKMHLLKAEAGVWKLDDSVEIHYADLDGDGYLDSWRQTRGWELQRQLYALGGYVVHAGDGMVLLKAAKVPLSFFETLPPGDHEEWLQVKRQLETYSVDFAPDDFEAMAAQFEGPEWRVQGASMRSFRADGEGFRFVLDLQPGFTVSGSGGPDLTGMVAGAYIVRYQDKFDLWPLTPAQLEVVPGSFHLGEPSPVALQPVWIEATLQNHGLEDAPDLYVRAYAEGTGGQPDFVAENEIALLAGESVPVRFEWIPSTPGQWRVSLEWSLATDGEPTLGPGQSVATLDVQVASSPSLRAAEILRISNAGQPLSLLLLLAAVALAAASLLFIALRRVGRQP